MKNKSLILLAIICSTAVGAFAAPDADALQSNEKAAWQAFKDQNADNFKKLVSPKIVAVYPNGIFDLQHELDMMKKVTMKSFSLSDFNVTMSDADTAVVTYKAHAESSFDGKDDSGDSNCASIWKKSGGAWQAIFHTDMKVDAAADAEKKE